MPRLSTPHLHHPCPSYLTSCLPPARLTSCFSSLPCPTSPCCPPACSFTALENYFAYAEEKLAKEEAAAEVAALAAVKDAANSSFFLTGVYLEEESLSPVARPLEWHGGGQGQHGGQGHGGGGVGRSRMIIRQGSRSPSRSPPPHYSPEGLSAAVPPRGPGARAAQARLRGGFGGGGGGGGGDGHNGGASALHPAVAALGVAAGAAGAGSAGEDFFGLHTNFVVSVHRLPNASVSTSGCALCLLASRPHTCAHARRRRHPLPSTPTAAHVRGEGCERDQGGDEEGPHSHHRSLPRQAPDSWRPSLNHEGPCSLRRLRTVAPPDDWPPAAVLSVSSALATHPISQLSPPMLMMPPFVLLLHVQAWTTTEMATYHAASSASRCPSCSARARVQREAHHTTRIRCMRSSTRSTMTGAVNLPVPSHTELLVAACISACISHTALAPPYASLTLHSLLPMHQVLGAVLLPMHQVLGALIDHCTVYVCACARRHQVTSTILSSTRRCGVSKSSLLTICKLPSLADRWRQVRLS